MSLYIVYRNKCEREGTTSHLETVNKGGCDSILLLRENFRESLKEIKKTTPHLNLRLDLFIDAH